MCLLLLAINTHPECPLVIAANRDEYFQRPSRSMHFWADHPGILAGRDLSRCGSWLGANRSGKFCAVTNLRTGAPRNPDLKSRGELVRRYLDGAETDAEFTHGIRKHSRQFNPFNVVYGSQNGIRAFCSQDGSLHTLETGYHGLSNGPIGQCWPKISAGTRRLARWVDAGDPSPGKLNAIMRDEAGTNPDQPPGPGTQHNTENYRSSIFIRGDQYGTRTTTCLLFYPRDLLILETNYNNQAEILDGQEFSLPLS